MTASTREIFDRDRYAVLRALVAEPLRGFLWRYVLERVSAGAMGSDADWPGTPVSYGDLVMEHMLERLRPDAEAASGRSLFPTYSYLRVYQTGNHLKPHRDRPACEFSLSLAIGQEPASGAWPLWVRGPSGPGAVELQPGDAVLYRGMELEHWREPYAGVRLAQVFLHYVDRDGPCAEWKFDKRESLAMSVRLPI
jgi:hypothetical protein